ncbi:MAG: substrate-binding domain-containing protein [Chitinivibrionia bacterium]|nr:substrate-binding domain-containing protein [Chitinivibrionia bacterium]
MRKQVFKFMTAVSFAALFIVSCARNDDQITVVSREEGSGTRSAFTELAGVVDAQGRDMMTVNAEISNNTSVVINAVIGNTRAIGYISMGSLNNNIKALKIDGVAATPEMVTSGDYKIARPFLIGTKNEITEVAQDFINFMLSANGQQIVASRGYIGIQNTGEFVSSGVSGRVVVAGSSSVAPLMERFREAYMAINTSATVEVQQNSSSAGIRALQEGICDIAMSSRELRPAEIQSGITPTTVALDGIAVIVNTENKIDNLSLEQVRGIFLGEITEWSKVRGAN